MKELESFYSNLYDGNNCADSETISLFLKDLNQVPKLSDSSRSGCEGKLGYGEYYSALQTFQKNKFPGNDGLTVEFTLPFGL